MRRAVAVLLALVLAAAGCSSDDDGGPGGAGGDALARLNVLATQVEVRSGDQADFVAGRSGQGLSQQDQVRADATGLAEVVYFDGSWQRVESDATLVLEELSDTESGDVVRTGLDQGRAWQRVQSLTEEGDAFEVTTPVAVATVRGTAFSIECRLAPVSCTFAVVEGIVELRLPDSSIVTLQAGQRITITEEQPPPGVEDVGVDTLRLDEWIAENIGRDGAGSPPPSSEPSGDDEAAFAAQASAICTDAGARNAAAIDTSGASDEVALQQAEILDDALDQLDQLEPPEGVAADFEEMLSLYRTRNLLVRQAVALPPDARDQLIADIIVATGNGAERARRLGIDACAIRPG